MNTLKKGNDDVAVARPIKTQEKKALLINCGCGGRIRSVGERHLDEREVKEFGEKNAGPCPLRGMKS